MFSTFWQYFKEFSPYFLLVIGGYLSYFYSQRNKKKELDINKINDLNLILAQSLIIWSNLVKLKAFCDEESNVKLALPISKKNRVLIFMRFGFLKESSFHELDASIKNLQKQDPLLYYELEGIGHRPSTILNKNLIPLIKNSPNSAFPHEMVSNYLNQEIIELESKIKIVAKQIGKETYQNTVEQLSTSAEGNFKETHEMVLQNIYHQFKNGNPSLTYETFLIQLQSPEFKNAINSVIEVVIQFEDIGLLIQIANENSEKSIEDYLQIVKNSIPNQVNNS